MSTITINDDGFIFVNGVRIDALVQSQDLRGTALMEREATERTSGKTTQFTGFDDTKISLSVRMTTGKKYIALAALSKAFKKIENGVPVVYALDFRLAKAMNIAHAIISDVRVSKGSGRQDVTASLTLTEIDPPVQNVQKQQQKQEAAKKENATTPTVPEQDSKVEEIILTPQDIQRFKRLEGLQ